MYNVLIIMHKSRGPGKHFIFCLLNIEFEDCKQVKNKSTSVCHKMPAWSSFLA